MTSTGPHTGMREGRGGGSVTVVNRDCRMDGNVWSGANPTIPVNLGAFASQ